MTTASIVLNGQIFAVDFPARSRRRTDPGHHVSNVRPSNVVVQRPGGPLYDHQLDPDWIDS